MNTHTRTKAGLAALLTATALALTACGSDSKSGDDKEIDGAKKATQSASPGASPPDDGIQRPKITFPGDVQHVFEGRTTGDPKKDAVLADNERNILAEDDAIIRGDAKSPALKFYNQGEALIGAFDWVQKYLDADLTFTGTIRYFDRRVTLVGDNKASLAYCGDESKAYNKNRKTKKVDKAAPSADSYVLYNSRLVKNDKGVWQTTKLISKRGDRACQQ
ncbi:hypothetical protein ABZS71_09905 [Streptomyces sp. NPDC005393]|uniref:hypothetical protein n=1 Tax=Streptomyces sp. NPDC005393 TaxID=3157041 RepID=UPI00339E2ACA